MEECYPDLIRMANEYYDMVIVDVDKLLRTKVKEEILRMSSVNVYVFLQKLSSLNKYNELKQVDENISGFRAIPVIGRYDNRTKYNFKNITKYLGVKKELNVIPFNQLFYEAAEECNVVDLFLKLKNVKDTTDDNYIFNQNISKLMNDIVIKLQELQKKMRWENDNN